MPRFFVIKADLHGPYDTDAEDVDPNISDTGPDCPECGKPIGMFDWLPPYRVKIDLHGKEPGDYIEPSGSGRIVSQRFANAFRAEGLTGLSGFHPVEVVRVRRQRRVPKPSFTPFYVFVSVAFGCASVNDARSRLLRTTPVTCDACRSGDIDATYGFSLDPASWTGEDIFEAKGKPGTLIVSERFVQFVQKYGFTNMLFTPTEEYVSDPLRRGPPPAQGGPVGSKGAYWTGGATLKLIPLRHMSH